MKRKYSNDLLSEKHQLFAIEKSSFVDIQDKKLSHIHDFYEILFVYSGKRKIVVNNSPSTLDTTHIAFISPYKFHNTRSISNAPFKRILINFTFDFIKTNDDRSNQQLLSCFNTPKSVITFSSKEAETITEIFQRILFEYSSKNDEMSNLMIKTLLSQLLLTASRTVLNTTDASNQSVTTAHYHIILNIANYIADNFEKKITLDLLETEFQISKFIISREFKIIIGQSFVDYLNNIRIQRAQTLLTSNIKKNITDIAFECGFDSLPHFTRTFKKHTGLTPTQFIKNNM